MKQLFFIFSLCSFLSSTALSAQELTMFTGRFGWEFYQDDKKIESDYFKKLLSGDPGAAQNWKKYHTDL